ncbi:MAG: endonuclease/exonuclease/phosphatase family protein, partial [Gemmataceae bacterium]
AGVNTPVIVAGDLNANPYSKPLAVLTPQWTVATGDKLFTFPAGKPTKQIDYVLFRPAGAFKFVGVKVIDEPVASDHRPLLAVLGWQQK